MNIAYSESRIYLTLCGYWANWTRCARREGKTFSPKETRKQISKYMNILSPPLFLAMPHETISDDDGGAPAFHASKAALWVRRVQLRVQGSLAMQLEPLREEVNRFVAEETKGTSAYLYFSSDNRLRIYHANAKAKACMHDSRGYATVLHMPFFAYSYKHSDTHNLACCRRGIQGTACRLATPL